MPRVPCRSAGRAARDPPGCGRARRRPACAWAAARAPARPRGAGPRVRHRGAGRGRAAAARPQPAPSWPGASRTLRITSQDVCTVSPRVTRGVRRGIGRAAGVSVPRSRWAGRGRRGARSRQPGQEQLRYQVQRATFPFPSPSDAGDILRMLLAGGSCGTAETELAGAAVYCCCDDLLRADLPQGAAVFIVYRAQPTGSPLHRLWYTTNLQRRWPLMAVARQTSRRSTPTPSSAPVPARASRWAAARSRQSCGTSRSLCYSRDRGEWHGVGGLK
jgi:hypothetical protein